MNYCSIEQLVGDETRAGYLPQVSSDEDKATLAEIITRVSRRIDAYVTGGEVENYFAPSPEEPTDKIIYGDGCSFLHLPEFVPGSVSKITGLYDVEITQFVERGSLVQLADSAGSITRGCVFGDGVAYTITARWGLAATPDDIAESALQLTVRTYRSKDEAFSGVIGGLRQDGSIIERAMPAAVKEALDVRRSKYRRRRLTFA